MKAAILTLGCKTNQAESSIIEGSLGASGYKIVDLSDNPEICIIKPAQLRQKAITSQGS